MVNLETMPCDCLSAWLCQGQPLSPLLGADWFSVTVLPSKGDCCKMEKLAVITELAFNKS